MRQEVCEFSAILSTGAGGKEKPCIRNVNYARVSLLIDVPCGEAILGIPAIQVAAVAAEAATATVVPWLAKATRPKADPGRPCHAPAAVDRVVVTVADGPA